MRQIFGDIRWEMKALVFCLGILVFVLVGPFGTYAELTLAERIVFWTAAMTAVGFFMHVTITLALNAQRLSRWPRLLRIALASGVAAIPSAAIVAFIDEVFRPSGVTLETLVRIWWQITILGTIIGGVEYVDWRAGAAQTPAQIRTRFHDRLSADLGPDIISLSMHDHYVEVTTAAGKDMILMRLADALQELQDYPGLRLHRSHWAATGHLIRVTSQSGRSTAHLSDGRKLPVSGTYLADLKAALPLE